MTAYQKFQQDQGFRYKVIAKLSKQGYLFHGTNDNFDSFDSSKIKGGFRGKEGYGAYFTKDAYKVEEYGNEFVILSTNNLNIVNSKQTFNELGIKTPNDLEAQIEILNDKLYNVVNNREYEYYNNQIEQIKHYLNDTVYKDLSYDNYKTIKSYSSIIFKDNATIFDVLKFGYNKLPSNNGLKDISQLLCNLGIDGYIIDNVYVIINFEKLNNNIVKDKENLINGVIKENKNIMLKINENHLHNIVEDITNKILKEEFSVKVNKKQNTEKLTENDLHMVVEKTCKKILNTVFNIK